MNLIEELKALGVDTDEAKARMGGNVSLYERMLVKFADMIKKSSVQPGFDYTDYAEMIEAAHAIKGASGNLSITPIYQAYSEIVRLLREDKPQEADDVLKKVVPVQTEIINCIEKYS